MRKFFSSTTFRFVLFLLFIAVCIGLGEIFEIDQDAVNAFFEGIPRGWAAGAFILLYVVGTFIIWYLKDPLKVVGAIVFGAYLSTFLIYIAEIINAYIFFHISSILGKDFVEKKIRGRFKRFYEKVDEVSLGWVFLLRAVPLIPYRVLDLSFGLSRMPFRKYLLVVLLASLPRIFWIQFIVAGIKGFSVEGIMRYFEQNIHVYLLSFLYFVIALIAAVKIKKKFE